MRAIAHFCNLSTLIQVLLAPLSKGGWGDQNPPCVIGIRGGAVFHIKSISAGVSP
jgi:hypothetical protein